MRFIQDNAFDEPGAVVTTMFGRNLYGNGGTGYLQEHVMRCSFPYPKIPFKEAFALSKAVQEFTLGPVMGDLGQTD